MAPLSSELRSLLERTVIQAREVAEAAAAEVLTRLAIGRQDAPPGITPDDLRLRKALRARARQLGDGLVSNGIQPLVEEIAYEQWHRMLFARFLAENGLLMHPLGVPVTLQECAELAPEEGEPDAWALAARYAGQMLPGIFRADDPAIQVRLAPEGRTALERLLMGLPATVFHSEDALGWSYQFWQSKKKEEINRSGRKIGGKELHAVTQLFTEHYMVRFLLENTLGAWWVVRHPESPLREELPYLRVRDDGTPAVGTFPGWPNRAAEVTVMDPCCGSGHFLVEAFHLLRAMRMEEEGLSGAEAGAAVLRENLFGLELDRRCTQIAAFALVFAAWKADGYRPLPVPNIACSGIPVHGQLDAWRRLAGEDERLANALAQLHGLFTDAPTLGSLIDPRAVAARDRLFTADFEAVEPLLERVLARERAVDDPVTALFGETARGVARAARLLAGRYTLVATNVPYLARGKQADRLKEHCAKHYPDSKADLATVFLERCRAFTAEGGTYALVTPQNWLFLTSYRKLREKLLREQTWEHVSRLGEGGFESAAAAGAFTTLVILSNREPEASHVMTGLDASEPRAAAEKAALLRQAELRAVSQARQLENPDARIVFGSETHSDWLSRYATGVHGLTTGDRARLHRYFWEFDRIPPGWVLFQSTVSETVLYAGREGLLFWNNGTGPIDELPGARKDGQEAWGKSGVVVSQMRELPCTLYTGELFDNNTAVILPKKPEYLPAIWAFCSSPEFNREVRKIDQKLNVTNATLVKVPFDLEYWTKVAQERYPDGLPEPHSNDPTQWLFKGHPVGSTAPLQVAVARLLGYRWPEQEPDGLDAYADPDGIVCLPAVAGELPAAERLRTLLAAAYGDEWSPRLQQQLLAAVGFAGKTLDDWLRDGFFAQHCRLFHNRPFIWHIWDGRSDGFSALVNYHKLDYNALNRLIYTYLGDWIRRQRAEHDRGAPGAEGRLLAAQSLQKKLEKIREGEPPYDIYVRWKPLHEQPIGWNPDLNDGVRMNIRPFVTAGVLRSRFTINWNKDRGRNPDGSERHNDRHYKNAEKLAARQRVQERAASRESWERVATNAGTRASGRR